MPQPQTKQTKSKRSQKNKLSKIPFVCIVILLIAVVIVICMVIKNNLPKNQEEGTEKSQQTGEQKPEVTLDQSVPLPEQTLIDMNNTENAKVENGVKENTSAKLAEPKNYKGLVIKEVKLVAEGGTTHMTAKVENVSSQVYPGEGIVVIFTKADGSEYARLEGILPTVRPGETNELDAKTTEDLANAYDFTVQPQ